MEDIQCIHLLTHPDELNRLIDDGTDGEGSTTAGIPVKLSEDDAVEVKAFVEGLGRIHSVLPCHRVDDEERLRGADSTLDLFDLTHHLFIDSQTTSGVDDHDIAALTHSFSDTTASDAHGILAVEVKEYGDIELTCQHAKLLDSSGTIDVTSYEHRFLALLGLEEVSQLPGEGRLP